MAGADVGRFGNDVVTVRKITADLTINGEGGDDDFNIIGTGPGQYAASMQGLMQYLRDKPEDAEVLAFAEALVGEGEQKSLAMAPSKLGEFVGAVRDGFEAAARQGEIPVLLTSPGIRTHVRAIVDRFRPHTVVMSQAEVHPRVRLKTVGAI